MAKKGTLTVKVLGNTQDFDKKMTGLGKTAGVAFAAVGTTAAIGAAKALTSFVGFETQMNEVFTLLPGISQDAMDDMTGQVQNFSKEFGVLPDEVVPALYQSLSAGVPQDNVFEFLETAQKAAKGGVTDLTTAVDGISSVVNAYGADVVNATEASDLMFTAVRLGKTNFEELSASLSNVTPIASGLGVSFEDVSAGMATLTAKGTPTAQATTQLRSLFVELSKAGGKTAKTFEDIAGKSFQEFIAEGGNTEEALRLMETAATESGVELQDLFGSVEAGSAALSLASGTAFAENIDEMGNAAGATDAAFDQMMTGLGPVIEKLKAFVAVAMIQIGEKLAPIVEAAMDRAGVAFAILSDWWDENSPTILGHVDTIKQAITDFVDAATPVFERFVSFVRDNAQPVLAALAVVVGVVLVSAVWSLVAGFAALFSPVVLIVGAIAALTGAAVWAYQNVDWFREAVDKARELLVAGFAIALDASKVAIDFLWAAIETASDWLQTAWEKTEALRSLMATGFKSAIDVVKTTIDIYWSAIETLAGWIQTAWDKSEALRALMAVGLKFAIDGVKVSADNAWAVIETLAGWLQTAWDKSDALRSLMSVGFKLAIDGVKGSFDNMKESVETLSGWLQTGWDKSEALRALMVGGFKTSIDVIKLAFDALKGVVDGVVTAIGSVISKAQTAQSAVSSIPGAGVVGSAVGFITGRHAGGHFNAPTPGGEGLALLRDGERVVTPEGNGGGGSSVVKLDPQSVRDIARALQQMGRAS